MNETVFVMATSFIGAVISCLVYYASIIYIDSKNGLGIKKKGIFIKDFRIWIIELVMLVLLTWIGYKFQLSKSDIVKFFPYVYITGLSILTTTDLIQHIVPNKILLIMLLCWMGMVGVVMFVNVYRAMEVAFFYGISAIIAGIIFFVTYLVSKKKLGMGDIKLSFIMGLFLGNNMIIPAILYGTVLCCVYSIIQVFRKKLTMKDGVPMVPFLYLGSLIVLSVF